MKKDTHDRLQGHIDKMQDTQDTITGAMVLLCGVLGAIIDYKFNPNKKEYRILVQDAVSDKDYDVDDLLHQANNYIIKNK